MSEHDRPVEINISGIPVAGIGGLGLVAMAVLVSVVMPAARWTMVAGVCGGVVFAVALIVLRKRFTRRGPSGDDPAILFRAEPGEEAVSRRRQPPDHPMARSSDYPIYSTR